jgi:parallel beta-helix repeat protein
MVHFNRAGVSFLDKAAGVFCHYPVEIIDFGTWIAVLASSLGAVEPFAGDDRVVCAAERKAGRFAGWTAWLVCASLLWGVTGCGHKAAQGAHPAPPAAPGRTINVTPRTFASAVTTARPGDTLVLADGEYSTGSRQTVLAIQSTAASGYTVVTQAQYGPVLASCLGESGRPVTLRAQGKGAIVKGTLQLSGSRYVVVDGLRITGGFPYSVIAMDVDHVVFRNCVVYDTPGRWSVYFNNARDCVIENNDVSGGAGHGISVFGNSRDVTVRGNRVHDCASAGIYFEGYTNPGCHLVNILVEGNVISGVGKIGSAAITCGNISDSIFRNNVLYKNLAGGFSFYQPEDVTNGIPVVGDVVLGIRKLVSGPDINARNTIVSNTVYFEPGQGRFSLKIIHKAPGFYIHNNVFYGGKYTTISVGPQALRGLSMDDNVVIAHKGYPLIGEHEPLSVDVESTNMSIADWRAKGYDLRTKFNADPLFVSVDKDDYHLSAKSPAIGAGADISTRCPVDIDGVKRPKGKAFDCGAYQYGPQEDRR